MSKYKRLMTGGPYHGVFLMLNTNGTMIFSVVANDIYYKGKYDLSNTWVSSI